MEIKQEYKDGSGTEYVSFTYVGGFEGAIFDGNTVTFKRNDKAVKFFITEIAELMPYFEKWSKT